jgi:hypothetical protein
VVNICKNNIFSVGFPLNQPVERDSLGYPPSRNGWRIIFLAGRNMFFSVFDPPKLYENDEQQKRLI